MLDSSLLWGMVVKKGVKEVLVVEVVVEEEKDEKKTLKMSKNCKRKEDCVASFDIFQIYQVQHPLSQLHTLLKTLSTEIASTAHLDMSSI